MTAACSSTEPGSSRPAPAGPLRASAGTDICPHGAYVCGLEALAGAGLPARDVLDAGTARAARAIGVGDRTGSIEPGKDADLIAVRGDPLRDISVLHQAELIVARGTQVARRGPDGCTRPAAGMGMPWPNPPGRAPHDGLRPDHRR